MKWFFLALFIVVTTIHLYASLKQNKKLRAKSKPFILLSLIGFYVLSTETISWAIVAALFFSWVGDVFLIPKGVKWFTIGGIGFMISHAFFILGYNYEVNFSVVQSGAIIILAAVFVTAVSIIFSKLRVFLPKALFYPMFFYLLLNGTMNCFAVFRMLSNTTISTISTCVGAFLFFISDSSLFFVRFNKNCRLKTHFLVMLTYSIGELLIVLGLI